MRRGRPERRGQRLGEAADAVAAHLRPDAVGVVQRHPCGVTVGGRRPTSSPSAPIPVGGRTTRPARARRASATSGSNTTRKSLPSPWCLVSASELMCRMRRSTTGSASATGSCSTSIQRTRGSRRNHRSWRTANWRVRVMIGAIASSERHPAVEVIEKLLVAERLDGGARESGWQRVVRTSSTNPAAIIASHALGDAPREHVARPPQSDLRDRRSAGTSSSPGPNELNGGRCRCSPRARARSDAVGRLHLRRRRRVERGEPGVQRRGVGLARRGRRAPRGHSPAGRGRR